MGRCSVCIGIVILAQGDVAEVVELVALEVAWIRPRNQVAVTVTFIESVDWFRCDGSG